MALAVGHESAGFVDPLVPRFYSMTTAMSTCETKYQNGTNVSNAKWFAAVGRETKLFVDRGENAHQKMKGRPTLGKLGEQATDA